MRDTTSTTAPNGQDVITRNGHTLFWSTAIGAYVTCPDDEAPAPRQAPTPAQVEDAVDSITQMVRRLREAAAGEADARDLWLRTQVEYEEVAEAVGYHDRASAQLDGAMSLLRTLFGPGLARQIEAEARRRPAPATG